MEMIQEEYVTFKQAQSLKELGFPQEWTKHPKSTILLTEHRNEYHPREVDMEGYACPTLSLVQKWLREEKNLIIDISYDAENDDWYYWLYYKRESCDEETSFDTYEQALSAGINKCIEMLKL